MPFDVPFQYSSRRNLRRVQEALQAPQEAPLPPRPLGPEVEAGTGQVSFGLSSLSAPSAQVPRVPTARPQPTGPRSASSSRSRFGTFRDALTSLPAIRGGIETFENIRDLVAEDIERGGPLGAAVQLGAASVGGVIEGLDIGTEFATRSIQQIDPVRRLSPEATARQIQEQPETAFQNPFIPPTELGEAFRARPIQEQIFLGGVLDPLLGARAVTAPAQAGARLAGRSVQAAKPAVREVARGTARAGRAVRIGVQDRVIKRRAFASPAPDGPRFGVSGGPGEYIVEGPTGGRLAGPFNTFSDALTEARRLDALEPAADVRARPRGRAAEIPESTPRLVSAGVEASLDPRSSVSIRQVGTARQRHWRVVDPSGRNIGPSFPSFAAAQAHVQTLAMERLRGIQIIRRGREFALRDADGTILGDPLPNFTLAQDQLVNLIRSQDEAVVGGTVFPRRLNDAPVLQRPPDAGQVIGDATDPRRTLLIKRDGRQFQVTDLSGANVSGPFGSFTEAQDRIVQLLRDRLEDAQILRRGTRAPFQWVVEDASGAVVGGPFQNITQAQTRLTQLRRELGREIVSPATPEIMNISRVAAEGSIEGVEAIRRLRPGGVPRETIPISAPGSLAKQQAGWATAPQVRAPERARTFSRALQEHTTDRFAGINASTARAKAAFARETGRRFPESMDGELHAALLQGGAQSGVQAYNDVWERVITALGGNRRLLEPVNSYLNARHSVDVFTMKPDRVAVGQFNSIEEAASAAQEVFRNVDEVTGQRIAAAAKEVTDFYATQLQRKVEAGLVSQELANVLRTRYPAYNPLRYMEQELLGHMDGLAGSRRISVTNNDIRALSDIGHVAKPERPIDLLARYAVQTELMIKRNDAARAVIQQSLFDPDLKHSIRRVAGPVAPGERFGTISYMENGHRLTWEVPRWLENEAKHLGNLGVGFVEHFGQVVNAIPRAFLTAYNPAFFGANFMFDLMTVATTKGVLPHEVLGSLAGSFRQMFRGGDPVLREMIEQGGAVGGWTARTPERIVRDVTGSGNIALRTIEDWQSLFAKPFTPLNRLGQALEVAPRRAVFQAAKRRGLSSREAALEARRGTVDFQRAGTAIRQASSLFLYLNAAVQGTLLPARAVLTARHGRARAAWGLAGLAGAQVGIYAHNRQFPEYQDIPLEDKLGRILVMLPSNEFDKNGNKVPHYIAVVPLIREFAAITGPLNYMMERLDQTNQAGMTEFLSGITRQLNPFSSFIPGEGGGIPVPTYFGQRATEVGLNIDTFRGRPVVPPELEGLPAEEQFDEFTSDTARRLGRFLNFSPKKIDHLMRAGLGWDIMNSADTVLRAFDPEEIDPEIDGLLAALEQIQETTPPNDISREREAFLRLLTVEQRRAVEEAERRPRDPGLPVVGNIERRFYRKTRGQIYESSNIKAAKERGLSPEQTRNAGRNLAKVSATLREEQQLSDVALANGDITPREWIDARQAQGPMYQGALLSQSFVNPRAAQVQGIEEWDAFRTAVATMSGATADRRTKGEILHAGWRAIPMEEFAPGVPNIREWFRLRDQYREGLSPADRALLDEEIELSNTPIEAEYIKDMDRLSGYWSISEDLLQFDNEFISEAERDLWRRFINDRDGQRKERFRRSQRYGPSIRKLEARTADLRKRLRDGVPEVEQLLFKWGYLERQPQVPATEEAPELLPVAAR